MSSTKAKSKIPILLFAALLTIDVSVLMFEKIATESAGQVIGQELAFYTKIMLLPWTWAVIVLSPLQLLVWSKILSTTELSVAYPISSLCFPMTMIASAIFFHDHISWTAWAGGFLIAAGVGLVGGEHEDGEAKPLNNESVSNESVMDKTSADHNGRSPETILSSASPDDISSAGPDISSASLEISRNSTNTALLESAAISTTTTVRRV